MSMTLADMAQESCAARERRYRAVGNKMFEELYLREYLELSVQIGVKYWKQLKVCYKMCTMTHFMLQRTFYLVNPNRSEFTANCG